MRKVDSNILGTFCNTIYNGILYYPQFYDDSSGSKFKKAWEVLNYSNKLKSIDTSYLNNEDRGYLAGFVLRQKSSYDIWGLLAYAVSIQDANCVIDQVPAKSELLRVKNSDNAGLLRYSKTLKEYQVSKTNNTRVSSFSSDLEKKVISSSG